MFTITNKHTVKWPVTIRKPVDFGTFEKNEIDVVFEIINVDEYERISKKERDAVLERVLVGIESEIRKEGSDQPLDFAKAKAVLLRVPYAYAALLEAYFTAASGSPAQK